MTEFLNSQLDYIFFFYGLAFLMMAEVCLTMRRSEYQRLPWLWLGLFGIAHGTNEWLDMFSTSIGDSPALAVVRVAVLALSFIFLVEFGRKATARLSDGDAGRAPGRWIYVPLLLLAALGGLAGIPGLGAGFRYALGFVGGLWAAYVLALSSRRFRAGRGWLAASAVGMCLYAFTSGLVVGKASFFPADHLNTASFLAATGFPVQLLRGLLAAFMAFSVRGYYIAHCRAFPTDEGFISETRRSFFPLLSILAILILGWFMTQEAGRAAQWTQPAPIYRLISISVVLILCVLSVVFFVLWKQVKESAARSAALRVAMLRLADEKKLRDITSAIGEGVFVQDDGGRLTFMNPEAEKLLGWTEADLKGKDVLETVCCRDPEGRAGPPDRCPARRTLKDGVTRRVDDEIFAKRGGSLMHVSYVTSPIVMEGKVAGVVTSFQDATERIKLEQQRSEFYAMVTHDLKSPLTVALGYADLLLEHKRDYMDEQAATMVGGIKQSCVKLLGMVENFLAISRLEYGHIYLNFALVDISTVVGDLAREYGALANEMGIKFTARAPHGLPMAVLDKEYVQRAVANLLQNAMNYTPRGGSVELSAGHEPAEGGGSIVVTVTDTGRGIDAEDMDKVFNKFYRSKKVAGIKGSGLGLAIVKAVAEAHGGRVELTSSPGKGSIFRLILPTKTG